MSETVCGKRGAETLHPTPDGDGVDQTADDVKTIGDVDHMPDDMGDVEEQRRIKRLKHQAWNWSERSRAIRALKEALELHPVLLDGYTCNQLEFFNGYHPSMAMEVDEISKLYTDFDVKKISVIVPNDPIGNRISDGVNVLEQVPPKLFEIALITSKGKLLDGHPLMEGSNVKRFYLNIAEPVDGEDFVSFLNELRDYAKDGDAKDNDDGDVKTPEVVVKVE